MRDPPGTSTSSGWWQLKYFLFSPLFGEDSHFDDHIFSKGLKPPTSHDFVGCEKCPHPGWGGWDCWASP